jgi:ArsR family transcriptional regulator
MTLDAAARVFKALAEPNRIRILKMLEVRPLCVCEITDILGLATSTVSRHLAVLREAGLITDRKDGKWVDYRLNPQADAGLLSRVLELLRERLPPDSRLAEDARRARTADRNLLCG